MIAVAMTQPSDTALEYRTRHITLRFEPPDLIYVTGEGDIDEQDIVDMQPYFERHVRDWPYVLLLGDQTKQTSMSAGARKAATELYKWVPYRGTAICGGNFAMRTIGQMVMKVANMVQGRDNPTVFFKTEPEGRAWIEERRRLLAPSYRR